MPQFALQDETRAWVEKNIKGGYKAAALQHPFLDPLRLLPRGFKRYFPGKDFALLLHGQPRDHQGDLQELASTLM